MSAVRTIFDNCQHVVFAPDAIRECRRQARYSFTDEKGVSYFCGQHYHAKEKVREIIEHAKRREIENGR